MLLFGPLADPRANARALERDSSMTRMLQRAPAKWATVLHARAPRPFYLVIGLSYHDQYALARARRVQKRRRAPGSHAPPAYHWPVPRHLSIVVDVSQRRAASVPRNVEMRLPAMS